MFLYLCQGIHLNPSIYLMDEDSRDIDKLDSEKNSGDFQKEDNTISQTKNNLENSTVNESFQSLTLNDADRQNKKEGSESSIYTECIQVNHQLPATANPDDPASNGKSTEDQGYFS